jgi:tripartite-type tricarboxylate transporter receptor subunit TctC
MNGSPTRCMASMIIVSLAMLFTQIAWSQPYPAKPVRVIVPFAPGGGSDLTARLFSSKLSTLLGQQFIVDNRGGAGGIIGMEAVAKAPPDGYTIMMMSGSFSASAATHRPAFDPMNSILPVAEFGISPFLVTVHPSLPARNIKDLVSLARTKPGSLTYASSGVGGLTHLTTELINLTAKINMVHVPYKSNGAAITDLLSGQVSLIVASLPVVPYFASGRLRPLAVTTAKRWPSLPEIPTVAETLPGYEVELWFGAMAPRGTPEAVINRLNAAINKALDDPEMKKSLDKQGIVSTGGTVQKFSERIQQDYRNWAKVVEAARIKIE